VYYKNCINKATVEYEANQDTQKETSVSSVLSHLTGQGSLVPLRIA